VLTGINAHEIARHESLLKFKCKMLSYENRPKR